MQPLLLTKPSPALVQEALESHGFEVRITSDRSAKILRRGIQVGLWSGPQLELNLTAEELSRVRKSLTGAGLLAAA